MKSGTFRTEYLRWYLCNSTRYTQLSKSSGMQSSFEMCLPLTNMQWKRKQRTSHSFVMMRIPCGPRNSLLYLAVWWEGRLDYRMLSKDSDRTCNIKWLQQSLSSQGLFDRGFKVRQGILYTIPRSAVIWHPAYYDRSHESYQSAVDINRKIRIFLLSI